MPAEPAPASDPISAAEAGTLPGLFRLRAAREAGRPAYAVHDGAGWRTWSWGEVAERVARMRGALEGRGLAPGERVAIQLPNGVDWVAFDVAAMAAGLVTVPVYAHDSPAGAAHALRNTGARLCLVDTAERWEAMRPAVADCPALGEVWVRDGLAAEREEDGRRLVPLGPLLSQAAPRTGEPVPSPDDIATIIHTSGTTAAPKGVMLSHRAILWNAEAVARVVPPGPSDVFLSILPLAHAFERTMGLVAPMLAGAQVAFSRGPAGFAEDMRTVRPTVLIAVPRLYERIAARIRERAGRSLVTRRLTGWAATLGYRIWQAHRGRCAPPGLLLRRLAWPLLRCLVARPVLAALGGRLRVAVSGGSALPEPLCRFLVGLGVPLVEGYGLTETAPVVTATTREDYLPGSVGRPLEGLETRIAPTGELMVRTPGAMAGYWNAPEATAEILDAEGWLSTGDNAERREGRLFITGRRKDTIVLSSGQNVAPVAIETAAERDPLFDQVCVVGDGRRHLAALVTLNAEEWPRVAAGIGCDPGDPEAPEAVAAVLLRLGRATASMPHFAQVRAALALTRPWTVEDGTLTPTLKVRRRAIERRHAAEIERLYAGADGGPEPAG